MNGKKVTLATLVFSTLALPVLAEENESPELNEDLIREKLSRKLILPSDEDIGVMSEDELLNEIKNYDSEIENMMFNISIVKEQLFFLEQQVRSFKIFGSNLEEIASNDDSKTKNESSVDLKKSKKKRSIFFNINSIKTNIEYKEKCLEEIKSLKKYLDEENLKVEETKKKAKEKVEEIKNRPTVSGNPYASQGTNVSIPENLNSDEIVREIIDIVSTYIGVPYVWGGTTPNGFDCSGLMQYSFAKAGIKIPRTAREQQRFSETIEYEDLKPGDLIFWNTPATHVALYIGEGKILESPRTGLNVRSRYFKPTEKGLNYGRILPI